MSLNINKFKSKLPGGGARGNLFKVQIYMPGANDLEFLCTTATLPASSISPITVPYMGRVIKLAGARTFAEWTITILNDTNFKLRNAFEEWSAIINQHGANTGNSNYFYDGDVMQLDRFGKTIKTYHFVDMWPSEVGVIDLSHANNDKIEDFPVTLQYQYWTSGRVQ